MALPKTTTGTLGQQADHSLSLSDIPVSRRISRLKGIRSGLRGDHIGLCIVLIRATRKASAGARIARFTCRPGGRGRAR